MGKYTYPIILVGAAALAYFLYNRNSFGALPTQQLQTRTRPSQQYRPYGSSNRRKMAYRGAVIRGMPAQYEPQAKSEAKRWMAEVLAYQNPEAVERNTIDQATGMEQGRLVDYANLLRGRQETPSMEYFRANGIGRPM